MGDTIEVIYEATIVEIEGGIEIVSEAAQGVAGPTGADGVAQDFQADFSEALTWTVNHNLGKRPLVSLLSVGNAEMIAEIIHTSLNQFIVYFASPTAGRVRCV